MVQKANVDQGKIKMDKMARRRQLPCVRRSCSLYRGQVARGVVLMSMGRKKGDEEAKKEQRIELTEKRFL
ncbi:hypothetical protein [Absidia glauca]|uniref:Uncharacterized protein n=1 Tax=Absidia glauca TaxID=4829 RepID=A0A168PY79_ABSGL|nr:hypothetical protein [Absidia glauca]